MKEALMNVDLDSIIYNYRHLKCYYNKNVIAVLKDDAYGVGLLEVANALKYEEGLIIAINKLSEAILLREHGFTNEILYLNVFDKDDIVIIKQHDISVIIDNIRQLELLKDTNIKIHIKVNTGMNRLGLNESDYKKAIKITSNKRYNLVGIMTHFADSDKNHKCYELFEKYVKMIPNYENLIIHCFASSSLNEKYNNITSHIRVGIKLYGIGERNSFLHNALTLYSPILSKKEINAFQKVGYDYLYKTKGKGYLYILPLGYGQGWGRFNNSLGFNNYNYLSQAGQISMDYSTYFCKKSIDENEKIELFGKNIPIDIICKENQIDAHEILVKLKVKKNFLKKTI